MSSDKIIKVKASKPRNEKILTLLITRQGPQHPYTEVVKRDELIRYGYSEWMELLDLASKQTSALSSELTCALHLLIKKVRHKFISVPEHGMFYLDKNKRMCF